VSEYQKRNECAVCNNSSLQEVLNLNEVPLAGYFPTKNQLEEKSTYPLKLLFCDDCKLVQTDSVIDPDVLFKDYRYLSSVGLTNHFKELAKVLDDKFQVKDIKILEIGCNDGVLLEPLSKLGADVVGVDPASNVVKLARDKGLNVIEDYFNYENFKEHEDKYDLVLANNSFAHITDIKSIVEGVSHVLKPAGRFVFEVHYLNNLISENQWDNIYHEHIYYYSISALNNFFTKYGMTVVDFEEIPIHAGSIRVDVLNYSVDTPQKIFKRLLKEHKTIGNPKYMLDFTDKVKNHIKDFKKQIKELSKDYKIAGYGASGRANMFCNLTGLDESVVEFIVDESPERCGRYIANTKIPIVDVDTLKNSDVDIIIIFAWNYSKMIIEKTQFKKYSYLVAFPNVQLVDSYDDLKGFDSI
jgi:SAM-dependent methyltransferase